MPDSIRIARRIVKNWALRRLFVVLGIPLAAFGAFERLPLPADAAGRAGSGLAMGDATALWMNPSAASNRSLEAGWSQPFGLAEYRTRHLALAGRFPCCSMGLAFASSGDEAYSEQTVRASANRELSPGFRTGLAISWQHLDIATLESGNAFSLDLGVSADLRADLSAAATWRNVTRARLSGYADRLPESLAAGLLFRVEPRVILLADVVQDASHPLEARCGVEAKVTKFLILRTGALFDPLQHAFGFTVCQRFVRVNYALQWHRLLGATHFAGLELRLK